MSTWFARATARPVVRRALASALLVGPTLVAINHGDAILNGDLSSARLVRIALTILVPYAVSTFSSVQATPPHLLREQAIRDAEGSQASQIG